MRHRKNDELEEEIAGHLRMATRDRIEGGEDPERADASARRQFGNVALIRETTRAAWGQGGLRRLLQDLRFGARLLRRNALYTAIAIFTLALGIGATTAIYSVVYGVLLRPLPYSRPDQIVSLKETQATNPDKGANFTDPNFLDLRAQNRTLSAMAEYQVWVDTVSVKVGQPERLDVARVSSDFFAVMGVTPRAGRGFAPEEARQGGQRAALISDSYWRHAYGATPNLNGLRLSIGNDSFAVVGVLPPGFAFPEGASVWVPRELDPPETSRTSHNFRVVARLRDGVSLTAARTELNTFAQRLKKLYGKDIWMEGVAVRSLRDALTRSVRAPLLLLLGSVGFLLLVACSNVVNLQLAQATSREGELAVRAALGASPGRLTRQFLIESLLLSLASGTLGVLAAVFGVRALIASAPPDLPRLDDVAVNVPVLLVALVIAVATGAGLALITARRAAKIDPRNGLVSGGRGSSSSQTSLRTGRLIVASQIALTLILLDGAGLLGRSLLQVLAVDPGFRVEQIVSMTIALPPIPEDRDVVRRVGFLEELLSRLSRIPGVVDVGGTNVPPLSGGLADGTFVLLTFASPPPTMELLEKYSKDPVRSGDAEYCMTSAGYLRTLGIPLLTGRLFDDRDTRSTPHAALVNSSFVRKTWPNQNPLGRVIEFGNMDGDLAPLTVVGVVGDIRNTELETPAFPTIYVDYRQRPYRSDSFTAVLRTTAPISTVVRTARQVLRDLDPSVPPSFDNFQKLFAASIARRRFVLMLVALFATTALLLAIAGIYGVMGYSVAKRTREMGVRMALGALPRDVIGLVVRQGLLATAAGLVVGLCGSLLLSRSLESLLFGVSAWDPMTLGVVAVVLAGFGFLASYGPARRATRVDPQKALRSE